MINFFISENGCSCEKKTHKNKTGSVSCRNTLKAYANRVKYKRQYHRQE